MHTDLRELRNLPTELCKALANNLNTTSTRLRLTGMSNRSRPNIPRRTLRMPISPFLNLILQLPQIPTLNHIPLEPLQHQKHPSHTRNTTCRVQNPIVHLERFVHKPGLAPGNNGDLEQAY